MQTIKSYAKVILALGLIGLFLWSGYALYSGAAQSKHLWAFVLSGGVMLVYGATKIVRRPIGKVVSIALGCALLYGANVLMEYRSPQVTTYNEALAAYKEGDLPEAMKLFDASINAYKEESKRGELEGLVLPQSRRYLAARAHFHKAGCLLQLRKPKEAVEAYKEALRLNPGNEYLGLAERENQVMNADARYTAHNLELLFKSGQGGNGQGKGKGKPGDKQGKQGQDPSQDPSNRPGSGKGSNEDL